MHILIHISTFSYTPHSARSLNFRILIEYNPNMKNTPLVDCKEQRNARDLLMTELANRHFEKNYLPPVLRCPSAKTRTRLSATMLRGSHRHDEVYFTRSCWRKRVEEREGMIWYCLHSSSGTRITRMVRQKQGVMKMLLCLGAIPL